MDIYLVIIITLVAALIASLSQLLFKRSMTGRISGIRGLLALAKRKGAVLGVLGYLAAFGIYLFALDNAPLSFVYPMFASTFVFVFLLSVFSLHERFDGRRAAGIALILIGIAVVSTTL